MNGERKWTKHQDITDVCNFDFYRQWWKQCRERRTVVLQPNPACFLFLSGPWAKNDFYIFKWKKIQRNIVFHDPWKLHEIELSVSIGKVLLGHIHSCLFMDCPGHILCITRVISVSAPVCGGSGLVVTRMNGSWRRKCLLAGPSQNKPAVTKGRLQYVRRTGMVFPKTRAVCH